MRENLINRFVIWYNIRTGKRFWFSVRIGYSVGGQEVYWFNNSIGLVNKTDSAKRRVIGKIFQERFRMTAKENRMYSNGRINVFCSYLGYFKQTR